MKKVMFAIAVIAFSSFLTGCKKSDVIKNKIYYGESKTIGDGTVRSYVVLDRNKNPVSVGFNLTESALSGLPTGDGMSMDNMITLGLPAQAAVTGFNHLEIDWNPNGHEPLAIYGLPHFDFHFYIVGMDQLMDIPAGPDMTSVDPKFVPKDYFSGVMAVPKMGVHWIDSLSSEFHGNVFTKTLIYGFFNGNMLFVEPMITVDYLKTHPNSVTPVKQPQEFQKPGWYPTKYRVTYDAAQKQYFVSLEDLVKH